MTEKNNEAMWYVVHTYSGHENKVKTNIEKMVENRNMQDLVLEVRVPMEKHIENKDGRRKVKERKKFPGYVMIKMIMDDKTWYLVRNTRGVTGFVGPASKPVPLSPDEIKMMGVQETTRHIDLKVNDSVRVTAGPFESFIGRVDSVLNDKQKIKVYVSMFGRETLVELDFDQAEKI